MTWFSILPTIWLMLVMGVSSANGDDGAIPWSLMKLSRPAGPATGSLDHEHRVANEIDAFVFARLEAAGLSPAPVADKHTLVRRAYFDLLGLPPSPEQVRAFVEDKSPDAWIQLIDRLLQSPHYGERWGRHWLDVVRYADSAGFEVDESYPHAWRYRDYVVKSFNDDKPYDQFVQEQIAGDEIWPDNLDLDPKHVYEVDATKQRNREALLGTGLYGFGPKVAESALDAKRLKYETLTDWVDTTGAVFMGLTFACARCHDHKFDPISQEDYFAMQALFAGTVQQEIPLLTAMEIASYYDQYPHLLVAHEAIRAYELFQQRMGEKELTADEQAKHDRLRKRLVEKVVALPKFVSSKPNTPYEPMMGIPRAVVFGHEHPELIKPIHLLHRGELSQPQQQVDPALPTAVATATGRAKEVTGPFGSRKDLALWLTEPDHPLTSRVMVNRLWGWHMGQGLVASPNDFGTNGTPPSHPKLLDWLATEFVSSGWSIHAMHRLIMTSSTYQMTSGYATEDHLELDPQNRLLWRMNRRRLEAEALWDAVHATAGTINLKIGGRPVVPPLTKDETAAMRLDWKWPVSADPKDHTRRGLYILSRRNFRFPMFQVFDAPRNSTSCPQRNVTTVAPQALWSLNNPSVNQQAQHLAQRLACESGDDIDRMLEQLWLIALSRPIRNTERREAHALMQELVVAADAKTTNGQAGSVVQLGTMPPSQGAAFVKLCLAVYNLNEFSFID
jgi:hypothetical protein